MIPHDDLAAVTEAVLTEPATAAAFETMTLEYERELPGERTSDKLFAGVSSLANTAGGDLVIGVDAPQEVPTAIPGVAISDPDREKARLEDLLRNGLQPRLPR